MQIEEIMYNNNLLTYFFLFAPDKQNTFLLTKFLREGNLFAVQQQLFTFSDREKLLKFEAEVREFTKILRSLEQFIQTVIGQNNFW